MKILFWSNYSESGVTSNMIALGIMMSRIYRGKSILMANHYSDYGVDRALLGADYENMVHEKWNYQSGSTQKESIHRVRRRGELPNCEEHDTDEGLFCLFRNPVFGGDVFEYDFNANLSSILEKVENECDYVFIDAKSQENLSTKILLDVADLVVVCLRQEENAINNFFKRYESITEKCVFLLSSYQPNEVVSLRKMIRKHTLDPNRVSVVPFNKAYRSACKSGWALDFILDNLTCKKGSCHYPFISYVKIATSMVMRFLIETAERQEGEMRQCISGY